MKPVDPSTWRFGIPSDSIVRDAPEDGPAEASEPYYGGRLVAESMDVSEREFILRACKAHAGLMAAAQAAADYLEIHHDRGAIAVGKMLDAAIGKGGGFNG